jgi:hypothetical protein
MSHQSNAADRAKGKVIAIAAMAVAALVLVVGARLGWRHYWDQQIDRALPTMSLEKSRLLGTESISIAATTESVILSGGKADFIEWSGQTLIRRDGVTGRVIWDTSRPAKPWDPRRDPVAWIQRLAYYGDDKRPGKLVQPAPDLNADGTGDLVWAIEGAASIVAISGKDGSLLWTYSAKADGPGGPDPAGPAPPRRGDPIPPLGRLFADPLAADVDGDGVADVIAAFAMLDAPPLEASGDPTGRLAVAFSVHAQIQPVVVAVSGLTGRSLWNYALPRKRKGGFERSEMGLAIVSGHGGSTVALSDQRSWIGLDPATGLPRRQPIQLSVIPLRPLQYADVNADGEPELLAVGHVRSGTTLVAVSSVTGVPLWSTPVRWERFLQDPSLPIGWPLVADLDRDGKPEIVVGDLGLLGPGAYYRGVRMLDGATGAPRWVHPLSPVIQRGDGLFHLIEGPDVDGDGMSDILAVSLFGRREPAVPHPNEQDWIYVDAISARDGHSLWTWRTEVNVFRGLSAPRWIGKGRDGRPLFALIFAGRTTTATLDVNERSQPLAVCLLESSTGHLAYRIEELSCPRTADLDGDKIDDLWGAVGGELRAFRGEPLDARGATVQRSPVSMDRRWTRSLPWCRSEPLIHPSSFIPRPFPLPWSGIERDALWAYAGLVGLSLVAIVIPLAILKLAIRRRIRNLRILAALPLAVALPLTAYIFTVAAERSRLRFAQPTAWSLIVEFMVGSAGGLPILAYLWVNGSILVRRRFRQLATWAVLTAIAGLLVGLIWIWSDIKVKSSLEQYSWSGWYQPVVPGAYYLGAITGVAWVVRGVFRVVKGWLPRPVVRTAPTLALSSRED